MSNQKELHNTLKEHSYLFSPSQITLLQNLVEENFGSFISSWKTKKEDDKKKRLINQIENFSKKYQGGMIGYLKKAREKLLEKKLFSVEDKIQEAESNFLDNSIEFQKKGIEHLDKVVINLMAGGLGERLGLQVNKLLIPFDPYIKKNYLHYYCQSIFSLQQLYFEEYQRKIRIPFVIITNKKGFEDVTEELQKNDFFHLSKEQIHIQKQLEVPCFNYEAKLIIKDFNLIFKPYGHGNVHDILLAKNGLADIFLKQGKKYLFFLQDTNFSAWNILLSLLKINVEKTHQNKNDFSFYGVKSAKELPMGRIVKVINEQEKKKRKEKIINIEYNYLSQMEEQLEKQKINIEQFHGNINLLFCNLEKYIANRETILKNLPVFVNSKKKDKDYPIRLEKMMQDISLFFDGEKVGMVYGKKEESFTPFKINLNNYREKPSPLAAEQTLPSNLELFFSNCRKILSKNNTFKESPPKIFNEHFTFNTQGKISLHPIYFLFKWHSFQNITDNFFSPHSFVALNGVNIIFKNNKIEKKSALILNVHPEATLIVENLVIKNKGLKKINLPNDSMHFFDYKFEEVPIINIDKKGTFHLMKDLTTKEITEI